VDVGERVGVGHGVPPPETEVESANAGEVVIDYDDLQKVRLEVGRKRRSGWVNGPRRPKLILQTRLIQQHMMLHTIRNTPIPLYRPTPVPMSLASSTVAGMGTVVVITVVF
jgi:hypothetical protein